MFNNMLEVTDCYKYRGLYFSKKHTGLTCTFRASCCSARLSWAQEAYLLENKYIVEQGTKKKKKNSRFVILFCFYLSPICIINLPIDCQLKHF